jgi:branched-chain amino acid transport system substrate-binding protein
MTRFSRISLCLPFCLPLAVAAAATAFVAPAFAEDTITVGFTASQTGPLNVDSLGQQRGYEFWRDEVNAAGGINAGGKSYKVNFVSYDDQSVGGRVQQLYTRLVNQDRAQFLFSPYSSGLTAPAAVISEQYGKIMIDSGGAEEKPFQLGNKYLFMVITSASHYLSGRRGAESKESACADRNGLFRRSVLQGGAGGDQTTSRGRRPGSGDG